MRFDELNRQCGSPARRHGSYDYNTDISCIQTSATRGDSVELSVRLGAGVILLVLVGGATLYQLSSARPFAGRFRRAGLTRINLANLCITLIPAFIVFAIDDWLNPRVLGNLDHLPRNDQQSSEQTSSPSMYRSSPFAAKNDAITRILGAVTPSSIVASVAQAGHRGIASLASTASGRRDAPSGLGNLNNSCFQNSIIQGLASLRPLPDYLATTKHSGSDGAETDKGNQNGVANVLWQFLGELNGDNYNGQTLWTPKLLKNMNTYQQQDAQEYYSKLLDEVSTDIARSARVAQRTRGFEVDVLHDDSATSQHSDDSGYQSVSAASKADSPAATVRTVAVRNPLEGLLAQRVACTQCGHSDGLSLTPFNCLMLNLDSGPYDRGLHEMLDDYVRLESIPDLQCPRCTVLRLKKTTSRVIEATEMTGQSDTSAQSMDLRTRLLQLDDVIAEDVFDDESMKACKITSKQMITSTKTKQSVIARSPASLAIHVNRSVFDEKTVASYKNMADVKFPLTMDFAPWCLGSATRRDKSTVSHASSEMSRELTHPLPGGEDKLDADDLLFDDDREYWQLHPDESLAAGDTQPSRLTGPRYELRAVITHSGRHDNGHYICYRKYPFVDVPIAVPNHGKSELAPSTAKDEGEQQFPAHPDTVTSEVQSITTDSISTHLTQPIRAGENRDTAAPEQEQNLSDKPELEIAVAKWWRLSDDHVAEVSEQHVLGQGGVFMLFYDCIDPSTSLVAVEKASTVVPKDESKTTVDVIVDGNGDLTRSSHERPPHVQHAAENGVGCSESVQSDIALTDSIAGNAASTDVSTVDNDDVVRHISRELHSSISHVNEPHI